MDSQNLTSFQSAFAPIDLKDQNVSPLPSINIITPSKSVKSENDLSSTSESKSLILNDRYNRLPLSPASPMTTSGKKERLDIEAQKKQAEQNYNFVRQHLNKTDQLNDKFASFLKVLREKLEIPEGSFETVKDPILERIGELLSLRKLLKEEREAKESARAELEVQKQSFKNQIDVFNKQMENVLEESQAFLQTDPFVFKKSALASIVHGMDMKDEEVAHVDKVLLNIKEKKVIVEYNIEAKDLIAQEHNRKMEENNRIFDGWDGNSRNLLKATRRLAKRFIKTNYFVLYNITDFYRFIRDKDSKNSALTRIYTELDEKEKCLEELNRLYEEKEAGNVKHFAVEFMAQMHKFMNEMTSWWDTNFKVMKDVYQELSKSTMYMITDMQDRLIGQLEGKA